MVSYVSLSIPFPHEFNTACVGLQLGFVANLAKESKYAKSPSSEGAHPRQRMVRLGKEVASLNNDLPLNPSSSVFVRVDEQNMTLWQALITGQHLHPLLLHLAAILCIRVALKQVLLHLAASLSIQLL